MQDVLKSSNWIKSHKLSATLKSPLIHLCVQGMKSGTLKFGNATNNKFSIIHCPSTCKFNETRQLIVFSVNICVSWEREKARKNSRCGC